LNLELAQAAKKAGVKVYFLISASSANSKSFVAYAKMKEEFEVLSRDSGLRWQLY
jgi:uncharacterized protein YbjT (DUF2867 family)